MNRKKQKRQTTSSSNSPPKATLTTATSSIVKNPNQVRPFKRAKISRLPRDELKDLTNNIISTLQVNGPQTLQNLVDALNANKVPISRVLDVLLSTPLLSVTKATDSAKIVYRYCHGKKLPTSINMKSLRSDISYEMNALSETYELLIHLRSVCANINELRRNSNSSSSIPFNMDLEKELLECVEHVIQLEDKEK